MRSSIARVTGITLVLALAAMAAAPPPALAACCSVIQASTQTGLVKAREGTAGRTFEFTVTDAAERKKLKVGQRVEVNWDRNTAQLPPSSSRYQITNVAAPGTAAGGRGPAGAPGSARGPLGGGPGGTAPPPPTLEAVVTALVLVGTYQGVTGGQEGEAHVLLTGPAQSGPGGGMAVTLASSNTAVLKVPPVVPVPAGQVAGKFTFITFAVAADTNVTITATLAAATKTGTVKVVPAKLYRLEIPTPSVRGGAPVEGRVVLTGPPATAALGRVSLKSASPALVTVPSSVTVASGATQATFAVQTLGVSKETPVVVSAYQGTSGADQRTDTLTLLPPVLKSVEARGCLGPCTGSVTMTFEGKLPAEGPLPVLSSSHPSFAVVSPTVSTPGTPDSSNPVMHRVIGSFTAPAVEDDKVVTISVSHGGITKRDEAKILHPTKPDLKIDSKMRLLDRFGNEVAQPPDSQPFQMCVKIENSGDVHRGGLAVGPTALKVTYRHSSNSNVSRTLMVPVESFIYPGGGAYLLAQNPCFQLPGMEPETHFDVEVEADGRKEVAERSESNNDRRFRVERK